MKKKSPIALAALLLVAGSAALSLMPVHAWAETPVAAPAKTETVRREMGKPFAEIDTLIKDKQFPQALEKINALNAFENKTPYEIFSMERMRAVVASNMGDTDMLARAFDVMINSSFLGMPEKLKFSEGIAINFYNEKKYDQAKQWALRNLELNKINASVRELLARILYVQKDFAGAAKELTEQLQADDLNKSVPSQLKLQLLMNCYAELKDKTGYATVLERMVTHYPNKEYWGNLLSRIPNKAGFSDRLLLDWYRLLLATDNLEEPAQYVDMAELALLAGLPTEANKVVEAGYAANLLGTGKDAARHKPLRDKAAKQAAEDAKSMEAGEAAAKAAKTGTGMVNMGYNYVISAQYAKGIALMEQGIAKGGLKAPEEAKLHLGMAYLQSGNKAKAADVFSTIQATDGTADLARLWLLVR